MYEHKIGDISPVFQLGDQRYVVAKLISIQEKGMAAITPANRPMLEQKVREEKKADIISKKYTGTLEAIASASGQQVQQADSVRMGASYIPNLGFEPKVIGYTFNQAFKPNTVSPGIKGTGGVYFITVLNSISAPMPGDQNMQMQMLAGQRRGQEMQMMNVAGQLLQMDMDKKADVTYFPSNF